MVPTNSTVRDVLRRDDENDWFTLELIRIIVSLAALWHDFGKATKAFQKKLFELALKADALRHEWVSLRLFQAFVEGMGGTDEAWLNRLADLEENPLTSKEEKAWMDALQKDGVSSCSDVFKKLPPVARVVGWLILSHHRLPVPEKELELYTAESRLRRLPELINQN